MKIASSKQALLKKLKPDLVILKYLENSEEAPILQKLVKVKDEIGEDGVFVYYYAMMLKKKFENDTMFSVIIAIFKEIYKEIKNRMPEKMCSKFGNIIFHLESGVSYDYHSHRINDYKILNNLNKKDPFYISTKIDEITELEKLSLANFLWILYCESYDNTDQRATTQHLAISIFSRHMEEWLLLFKQLGEHSHQRPG